MHAEEEPSPRAMGTPFSCARRRPRSGAPHSSYRPLAVRYTRFCGPAGTRVPSSEVIHTPSHSSICTRL